MFPEAKPRETLRFEGNKINCFPCNQSLSIYYYAISQQFLYGVFANGSFVID